MNNLRAANLIVKMLEHEGVEYIFGVPGEENIDLMDALLDSKIEFIVTRHETGAAFMAGTYGRLTGKPGVCLATLGPGATNLLTGVANANMDQSPIVALTGQAGLERQHKESHQYYDLIALYRPVTKWNAALKTDKIISEVVRKAFQVAADEKPGATHIDIPEDIAGLEAKDQDPLYQVEHAFTDAEDSVIEKAKDEITKADHPLILAGNGVTREEATPQLRSLIDKYAIPVTHTFMGKGAIPWTSELSLLTTGIGGKDYITCGFEQADLIITIGFDMAEYSPKDWNPTGDKKILHIDTTDPETDSHYPVTLSVVGDIGSNLEKITKALPEKREISPWVPKLRENILNEVKEYEDDQGFPIKPQRIISDIRSVMGEQDIVISDVGAHKMWLARMYHCYEPNTMLISNGLASMGVALPAAIGAKLVKPDRKVVAVCGDGSFQMTGAELETAVRLKLPMVVLLWRDDGYGLIEWHQMKAFDRASHISFDNPDFVKLAESYGAKGYRIEKTEELKPVLQEALDIDGPALIDCPVDYGENLKLTEKLGDIIC
ncbi:acetolactate synthase large subunit [Tenuibacillus multivorans]|uniref:Acetolactate synthase-1/2/3 large subunit n=1 Tax=Tenuibacillus multivorans TaxID=237069 RepID=A0A1H0FIA6_9BACI|nr:acetolactate synthase large subunit [Tenuibacillus multivorans]GEL77677.1 acetolactate synthase [Tenuibacillus multivorans]SDN94407.1 acetolactate synthase-1/2/3 large subunit [Tenuibacillus multivorans]